MKVQFTRDGTHVVVKVTIWITQSFEFRYDAGSEWAAHLLAVELDRRFEQQVVAIRESEYNAGWHHHAKRAKKRSLFARFFA